ncbi:MAG: class I adenylate-forming enzyme family protein [Candidatus Hodarchaeota archaeon]
MKDYSDWKINLDFENESPYVNPNRPWLKFREPNVPKSIKFDPISIHEFIKWIARQYPNNVCVYHKPTDKKYTYRELIYYSDKIGNALSKLGVKKGHSVAIMSENCAEFIFCCIGIMETGAIVIPVNPLLKESDVSHIVREAGNVKAFFVHKNNFRTVKRVRKQVNFENVILIGTEEDKIDATLFSEFIKDTRPSPPDVDIDPINDIVALMFTGGTTGLPKGVIWTHDGLLHSCLSLAYASGDEYEERVGNFINLSILPLCHAMGFGILIIALYLASMLVMFPFNPSEVLKAIDYYRVSLFVGVPVMYQMIINSPEFTETDLSSLESAGSGSAALAPEFNNKWEKVVGFKVGQGYGLTESLAFATSAASWMPEIKPNSIGVPNIDTDVKIVNPDTLEELKLGEIGELLIKGPNVMKGYWKNPEATKKDIIDGWLRTGDLARMDEDGYFYIEGRTKDMVKYKGYKVMAREVEEKLVEHPAIVEAGVVGVPDPNIGETIKAYVVINSEYKDKITEREIIEWSKERLAAYKYPRQVEFINVLPRTAVGKIFRRKLRESAIEKQEKEKPLTTL